MIGFLSGLLRAKTFPWVLLDVHGVGYELEVPMSTFSLLPELEHSLEMRTHLVVREDAHLLFGFMTELERVVFRQLIKVSGIGPKVALGILSGMTIDHFLGAIEGKDSGLLTRIPGIGQKTAERLLLELQGKFSGLVAPTPSNASTFVQREVREALMGLGYQEREVSRLLGQIQVDMSFEQAVRWSLKQLSLRIES